MVQMDHGPHPLLILMNDFFFFLLIRLMNVFTLEEKRGKIYINTAAIFMRKFYIRKFLVSLYHFEKKN